MINKVKDTGPKLNPFAIILGIWMSAVIVAAFLLSPPLQGLGEAGRIFYFHVPSAWVGSLAFVCGAIAAGMYLRSRDLKHDAMSKAAAEIGLLFTILATVSGAIWAQAAWGKWWNWDPRQTFIFVVVLIYGAYFALRTSIDNPDQRARIAAVYSFLAMIAAIFLIYIAPRTGIASLHPSPILPSPEEDRGIEPLLLMVFLASMAGFTALFFWMWRIQTRLHEVELRKGESL